MSSLPPIRIRRRRVSVFLMVFLVATETWSAIFKPPFVNWSRVSTSPALSPEGDGFESAGTFNPAVIMYHGKFVMLYRAQDRNGTSSIGYATSSDGIHFTRAQEPVLRPETDYERGGGVEDPRLQEIGGLFYLTYTGYNNIDGIGPDHREAQLCLATSGDLMHWERKGVILPANKGAWNIGWTKSGAVVPQKIGGKYWMYYLGDAREQKTQMGVASSPDLLHWTDALDHPVLSSRPGMFDAHVVEPGPPPVMLAAGIFLIYNGADEHDLYSTGWALFDKGNPTRVIARSSKSVFQPSMNWEKIGQVPNVVFVEGLVPQQDRWLFYYGGADKYIGVASAKLGK